MRFYFVVYPVAYMTIPINPEYRFEALHNSVQAWIEYRPWAQYPAEWHFIGKMIQAIHDNGILAGVV